MAWMAYLAHVMAHLKPCHTYLIPILWLFRAVLRGREVDGACKPAPRRRFSGSQVACVKGHGGAAGRAGVAALAEALAARGAP